MPLTSLRFPLPQPSPLLARPEVENLHAYSAPLEGRRGLLRLDFNENTVGPSPKVVEAMGKLAFRTSYGQNVLRHSVEVAFLCQMIADELGVTVRYVRRIVAERRISYVKVGHLVRFQRDEVERWVDANRVNALTGRE